MKFFTTTFLLAALTATAALAMPAPEAEAEVAAAMLEKRQSCKRVRRFRRDQYGVCVDKANVRKFKFS
ncbi:MAG: hypothetical protein Q9173_006315 [Seirophora scorigena]